MLTRRQTVAGSAALLCAMPRRLHAQAAAPLFHASGPNADHYGAAQGFPARLPIETPEHRVGSFSQLEEILPTRTIVRAQTPWSFGAARPEISYQQAGGRSSIDDYLARNPVTGLIVAKGDDILFEAYQYGRTDRHQMLSQSMAKSITGLLVGIAIAEGAIRSVDDPADTYVDDLKGTEYGRTSIRDLLHMSSGVEFGEQADNNRDLVRLGIDLMGGYLEEYKRQAKGTIAGIIQFNRRIAPAGTRFYYASIEVYVLGVMLRRATGQSLSSYAQQKLWTRIGTEAHASWVVDAQGYEMAAGFFSATLRDYARLARLLAHDGDWNGRQIVPPQWLIDATTVQPSREYLAPGKADPTFGYGYLMWLLPWGNRQFALFGDYGQRICIDPVSKLMLVQTAVEQTAEIWSLWQGLVRQFGG